MGDAEIPMPDDDYLVKPMTGHQGQRYWIVMAALESAAMVLSAIACYRHFKHSRRLDAGLTRFQVTHLIYCMGALTCFIAFSITATEHEWQHPSCSGEVFWGGLSVPGSVVIIVAHYFFFDYWDSVYLARSKERREKRKRIRFVACWSMLEFVAIFSAVTLSQSKIRKQLHCIKAVLRYFKIILMMVTLYVFIEFFLLVALYYDLIWKHTKWGSDWKLHSYGVIKVIYCCCTLTAYGTVQASFFGIYSKDRGGEIDDDRDLRYAHRLYSAGIISALYVFLIPFGYITLALTWETSYLKEDDADQLESGGRITEVGQGTELVNRGRGGSDAQRLARSGSHVSHDDNHGEDRGSVGNPLVDSIRHRVRQGRNWSTHGDISKALTTSLPRIPLRDANRLRAPVENAYVTITESLSPPSEWTFACVRMFMKAVALPAAEAHLIAHVQESQRVLDKFTPTGEKRSVKQMEILSQFSKFERRVHELRDEVIEWNETLHGVARYLPEFGSVDADGKRAFRPSKMKKVAAVQMIPTNLQVHRTTMNRSRVREGGSGVVDDEDSMSLTVLTYGAPCAHAFGFKLGGLRLHYVAE